MKNFLIYSLAGYSVLCFETPAQGKRKAKANTAQSHAYASPLGAWQIKVAPYVACIVLLFAAHATHRVELPILYPLTPIKTPPSYRTVTCPSAILAGPCIVIYYPAWQKGFSSINHADDADADAGAAAARQH